MMAHLIDLQRPLYFVVDGVLSPAECRLLIARIDAANPTIAPITTMNGAVVDNKTRNNSRVMFDDAPFAGLLYERIKPHVPEEAMGMRAVGANELLRCYKYERGQWFKPHYDGAFIRSDVERSLYTFMVYLNDGFEGGATALLDLDVDIEPKPGRALLFQHFILHEGCEVQRGVKYAVRSDIMYRRG